MRPAHSQFASRDPARAVFLSLLVLLQLLLPGVIARANGGPNLGCLGLTSGGDSGKGPSHSAPDHQQCAHCRPHELALAPPPAEPEPRIAAVATSIGPPPAQATREVELHAIPPPTGPPSLPHIV